MRVTSARLAALRRALDRLRPTRRTVYEVIVPDAAGPIGPDSDAEAAREALAGLSDDVPTYVITVPRVNDDE